MKHSHDRILTTHAGALPRPDELIVAMGGSAGGGANPGTATEDELNSLLAKLIPGIVQQQLDIGIDIVNDGEYGKPSWTGYVDTRLSGFELRPSSEPGPLQTSHDMNVFADYYNEAMQAGTLWHRSVALEAPPPTRMQYVCTQPIRYTGQEVLRRDINNLKAALRDTPEVEAFLPVAAPASVEVGRKNEYYAGEEEFAFALADAMAQEYRMIVEAGFVVQIDDAWIPALWDQMLPDADLQTYIRYCDIRIAALNWALEKLPTEMVRYHICWGSWHGPHVSDIPMKEILPLMLKTNAGAYVFEAANARHEHEYHLWEDVEATRGQTRDPGRRQSRDQRRRAP